MASTTTTATVSLHEGSFMANGQSRSTAIVSFLPRPFHKSHLLRPKKFGSQQCQVYLRSAGQSSVVCSAQFRSSDLVYGGHERIRHDKELRMVLELASDEELFELEGILFGPSYFSPLLKSITDKPEVDYGIEMDDVQEREAFISQLESRFLFLAADAQSTIRGWRPSYRDVLLCVRKKLHVPCSNKLRTEDLEVEIFLHLMHEYSSQGDSLIHFPWDSDSQGNLEVGLNQWKVQTFAALKSGMKEVKQMVLKGGGILTVAKVYQLIARRLSGNMVMEAANYQIKHEIMKKGGQIVAMNLNSRAALLAARLGYAGAASRYLGFRSLMMLLGPVLWGTLLVDVVKQMLGTDYARILRAIYAFAQIRLTRTHGWTSNN